MICTMISPVPDLTASMRPLAHPHALLLRLPPTVAAAVAGAPTRRSPLNFRAAPQRAGAAAAAPAAHAGRETQGAVPGGTGDIDRRRRLGSRGAFRAARAGRESQLEGTGRRDSGGGSGDAQGRGPTPLPPTGSAAGIPAGPGPPPVPPLLRPVAGSAPCAVVSRCAPEMSIAVACPAGRRS